eukprot:Hpha_TRINITY_DN11347_c0_g1::TRINITY_DN11347_c0_g1_i1::g.63000::m.63000/K07304/msrA; peptide-methionine (S)-S-oxide reductase
MPLAAALCFLAVPLGAFGAVAVQEPPPDVSVATFGMGCYWHAKATFVKVPGVLSVRMGYMSGGNGSGQPPCQDTISERKALGWVEVVNVLYDAVSVNYTGLLNTFFEGHRPWERARQGMNKGEQFNSTVFYKDQAQYDLATQMLEGFRKSPPAPWVKNGPYLTRLLPATTFIRASKGPQAADYFPHYHCHGKRPVFATAARSFSNTRSRSSYSHLPDHWSTEVARTRETMQRAQGKRLTDERRRTLGEYFRNQAQRRVAEKLGLNGTSKPTRRDTM